MSVTEPGDEAAAEHPVELGARGGAPGARRARRPPTSGTGRASGAPAATAGAAATGPSPKLPHSPHSVHRPSHCAGLVAAVHTDSEHAFGSWRERNRAPATPTRFAAVEPSATSGACAPPAGGRHGRGGPVPGGRRCSPTGTAARRGTRGSPAIANQVRRLELNRDRAAVAVSCSPASTCTVSSLFPGACTVTETDSASRSSLCELLVEGGDVEAGRLEPRDQRRVLLDPGARMAQVGGQRDLVVRPQHARAGGSASDLAAAASVRPAR